MMRTRKTPVAPEVEESAPEGEEALIDSRLEQIRVRPDGCYWLAPDSKQEFGPFESLELALADMASGDDEEEPAPGETLQEAENEIGIADWIDPETGEPAQGQSPPRLEEE